MMDIPRLLALPRHRVCLKQVKGQGSVYSVEQFHAILECEKARADRNAHQFSLVIFEISDAGGDTFQIHYFTHLLVNRVRESDETGWFDNKHIGVILPDTPNVGAQRFADTVCEVVKAKASVPKYTVYTYPSKPSSNGNGHYTQLYFADIFPQWDAGVSQSYSIFADHRSYNSSVPGTQQPLVDVPRELEPFYLQPFQVGKRAFDILFSIVALVALTPLFFFVSLLIKAVSDGPVFFKQKRVGYMGRAFTMWKFRTMKVNANAAEHRQYITKLINGSKNGADTDRPMTKLSNHRERIRFGNVLRRLCIDELPQLINVLCGQMSLVGPRPAISYEVEEYLPWHYRRFDVLPGMTGLWQVSGKNQLSFIEMVRLDIQYARRQSFWIDLKILFKTPFAIISQIISDLRGKK